MNELLVLADRFERAGYAHEDAAIEPEHLKLLGIKWQKTFKSKKWGKLRVSESWEALCAFVYEKVTGNPHPGCTLRGTGFRSQAMGRDVANAIREKVLSCTS